MTSDHENPKTPALPAEHVEAEKDLEMTKECWPSPYCSCCVCQGQHCMFPHPGHSHDGFYSEIVHAIPLWIYGLPLMAALAWIGYRCWQSLRQR